MTRTKSAKPKSANGNGNGHLGFGATLWAAADKLRGKMDASEYKHVILGLIFLKYISDAFEERHAKLASNKTADAEDRDEYTAANIFWVPKKARWSFLQGHVKQPITLLPKLLSGELRVRSAKKLVAEIHA